MKMNKLAAGALALALGLGAVAPAVAAEHSGAELVLEKYKEELKEVNKKRVKYLDATEKRAVVDKAVKEAEAELAAAKAAYEAQFKPYLQYMDSEATNGVIDVKGLVRKPVDAAALKLQGLLEDGKIVNYNDVNLNAAVAGTYDKAETLKWALENKKETATAEEVTAEVERFSNALAQYAKDVKETSRLQSVYQRYLTAQYAYDEAKVRQAEVYADTKDAIEAYDKAFDELSKLAGQYGLVVQVGNNGLQIVKPEDDKVNAPDAEKSKEELVKELKAAADDNRAAIKSAEFLLENAPKSVAKVKDKLEAQIVTAKAALAKAEAALEKLEGKVALVATAYADEDVSVDELESLIKENEDAANAINETIKENEKDQPEVDDEEEEEDKKEEDKKEEDKKEEEKAPAKKPGNNARTGIAGVAGVAGILAAASVAYAASKRD